MSRPIVKVENLSKQYRIGGPQAAYSTIRDSLVQMARAPLKLLRGVPEESFWALRDVNFTVEPGEVVGIIGRNGAGKSTLLKILSRITEPTAGRIELYGRVGSLLEVGTGFHPELTGRENIYLSGAVLGMARREIARKFDEIVAFAEIEKFLETPVKRYSSGMYTRLAFAVAAYLEPEILLVDEVLAVGDASFQRKCLDKMESVGQEGRTVLFVSHDMQAVTRLCPRAILLYDGGVHTDGPAGQVVNAYLRSGFGTTAAREWTDEKRLPGNDIVRLRAVRVRDETGRITDAADIRRPVLVEMEYQVLRDGTPLVPYYVLHNEEGACLFSLGDYSVEWRQRPRPTGWYKSVMEIPGNLLAEGTMFISAGMSTINPDSLHYFERDAVAFQVIDSLDGDSARGDYAGVMAGMMRPKLNWHTDFRPVN